MSPVEQFIHDWAIKAQRKAADFAIEVAIYGVEGASERNPEHADLIRRMVAEDTQAMHDRIAARIAVIEASR